MGRGMNVCPLFPPWKEGLECFTVLLWLLCRAHFAVQIKLSVLHEVVVFKQPFPLAGSLLASVELSLGGFYKGEVA